MAVLHILWMILKIMGIVLLVLLAILLLLVLAVLFCPVVYQAKGSKEADVLQGRAKISWLFHMLSFEIGYENQKTDYTVRIFGISIDKLKKFFTRRKKEKKPELSAAEIKPDDEKQREEKQREEKPERNLSGEKKEKRPENKEENKEEKKEEKRAEKRTEKGENRKKRAPKKKAQKKNLRLTGEEKRGKISEIKEFLQSEQFAGAKKLLFGECGKIVRHIRPTKIRGLLKFGTGDPCVTGEILAAAGIFYPVYGEYFTIEPYFEEKILEGNLFVRGRIRCIVFVTTVCRVLFSSDVRYIIKKFK